MTGDDLLWLSHHHMAVHEDVGDAFVDTGQNGGTHSDVWNKVTRESKRMRRAGQSDERGKSPVHDIYEERF
jgi:hypothetical protein